MKALLLAAGLGTRLRPITNTIPKCLVPINGKPVIEYWLDNLSKIGINEFVINTHYFSEEVEKFVEQSKYKDNIHLVYEEDLLLTGGTVLKNKELLKDEAFMVVHADNLSFCDFNGFIDSHRNRAEKCDITMMTFDTDNPKSCGVITKNDEGVVTAFYEKVENPPTCLANGAVYIFEPTIFEYLESLKSDVIDLSTEVIPNFVNRINTFHNDLYHRDIGTIESYAIAQIEVLKYV